MSMALAFLFVCLAAAFSHAESGVASNSWRPKERWIGVNLPYCLYHLEVRKDAAYNEEDFRFASELGFNFRRLPLDSRCRIKDGDWNCIDDAALAPLDQALEWGERYGLHIQFCFHRAPGYSVNRWPAEKKSLFRDPAVLEVCCRHWAHFARKWKGVPNERLSFNLLNEPPESVKLPDAMQKIVDSIHTIDPNRFVVVDGADCCQRPVAGLEDMQGLVGQSARGYYPMSISHCGVPWAGPIVKSSEPRWPATGFATPRYGSGKANWRTPLCISNAPAGKWEVELGYVSSRNRLVVSAYGKTVSEFELNPATNHNDWTDASYDKHWGIVVARARKPCVFTLDRDVGELAFDVADGDWVDVRSISVASGGRTAKMLSHYQWGARLCELPFAFRGWDVARPFIPQGGVLSGEEWLERNVFAEWIGASQRGCFVMVGECGATGRAPYDIYLRWMEDQMKVWRKHGFGFAFWTLRGPFGVIDTGRKNARTVDFHGHALDQGVMDLVEEYR